MFTYVKNIYQIKTRSTKVYMDQCEVSVWIRNKTCCVIKRHFKYFSSLNCNNFLIQHIIVAQNAQFESTLLFIIM